MYEEVCSYVMISTHISIETCRHTTVGPLRVTVAQSALYCH
jgi:hypothetical protein